MTSLVPVGPGLWQAGATALRLPGGVRLPLAAAVLQLAGGELAIYSPVGFDDATAAAIDGLGPVAHLIAPNLLHHLYLGPAAARWPRATVHAPAALRAKRPDLRIDRPLDDGADPAWGGALALHAIDGAPRLAERVLFHPASGALVCADLLFRIERPANLRSRLLFALMGVGGGRLAQSRAWYVFRKDRARAAAACERVLAWPVTRVVPVHGTAVAVGPGELARALTRLGGPALPPGP